MSNNADTTIKTEHQLEENLMGVLRTRNACRLPREHGQVKSLSAEKNETCFGMLVKKLAHTHRFEHEPSGLKSKHLTTRPRTPELCDLRAETSGRAEKKHPHFPITLVYHKCKKRILCKLASPGTNETFPYNSRTSHCP